MWTQWLEWAAASPEKRRALALLEVSDDITPESRQIARMGMADIAKLLDRSRAEGALRDAPLGFVVALMSSMANTTIDFMINDPANADAHRLTAFNAMWRMLT
jgi:hypothetical protein